MIVPAVFILLAEVAGAAASDYPAETFVLPDGSGITVERYFESTSTASYTAGASESVQT